MADAQRETVIRQNTGRYLHLCRWKFTLLLIKNFKVKEKYL